MNKFIVEGTSSLVPSVIREFDNTSTHTRLLEVSVSSSGERKNAIWLIETSLSRYQILCLVNVIRCEPFKGKELG